MQSKKSFLVIDCHVSADHGSHNVKFQVPVVARVNQDGEISMEAVVSELVELEYDDWCACCERVELLDVEVTDECELW